jgi:ATP-binding cassette subfamily C (CFTR/MRP) protein 4
VIGPVGSGKGSILQSILSELPSISGTLEVRGSIGYVSQDPWIFPASLRDNILFGKEFDSAWYDQVIDACALGRDLTLLPYGDHTLVGDRGTALSGGQKARINLAR